LAEAAEPTSVVVAAGTAAVTAERIMRAVLVGGALLLAGCSSDDSGYVPIGGSPPDNVITESIDTGAAFLFGPDDKGPGKGVGLFVEYVAGGTWHVYATCDTLTSGYDCSWDLVASVDPTKTLKVADQMTEFDASSDKVLTVDKGSIRVIFGDNSTKIDGVKLAGPAGAPLTLDWYWDNGDYYARDPSLVSFVQGGAAIAGARSDPAVFEPSTP
jgi:hypothetical protein